MEAETYMRRAIALAKKGIGAVDPNPLVGAVVVKDGCIIGEGYHMRFGGLHAERNALANCAKDPKGATMYVTLEPCCHHGKTPPCTEAVIQAGISKVVIGSRDPNPKVAGQGVAMLRAAGIAVQEDFLKAECDDMNKPFFHYITTQRPYVAMKYAMTADGKIATVTGASQWITNEESRHHVHTLRNRYQAIMVGIGTVLADDPMLTCRLEEGGRNPIRIVCDSRLQIPLSAKLVQSAKEVPLIVATCANNTEKIQMLQNAGAEVLCLEGEHVPLATLMEQLGQKQIGNILLEGGGTLNAAMLKEKLVQRMYTYIGAKVFGGAAKSPVAGTGVTLPTEAPQLTLSEVQTFGSDILCVYDL